MKHAKDLMTGDLIVVQSGSQIRDQVTHYLDNDISSAPVVTPMGELLGTLTEQALIRAYLILRLKQNEENTKVIHHKEILEPAVVVNEDVEVHEVIKSIMKSPTRRVFVQNNMKQLTGIIAPKDILRFLNGEDHKNTLLKDQLDEAYQKLDDLQKKLESTEHVLKNYQDIYQDAPAMMHSVDADGKIVMANKKIHQILGYDSGTLLGKSIFDIYAKSCHGEATFGLKKIMKDGVHNSVYTTMLTAEGAKLRVDVASSALLKPNGEFLCTISASRVIDSDALLRALHGAYNRDDLDENIENLLDLDFPGKTNKEED